MTDLTLEQQKIRKIVMIAGITFAASLLLLGIFLIIFALYGSKLKDWFERRIRRPIRTIFSPTLEDKIEQRVANIDPSGRNLDSGLSSLYECSGRTLPVNFLRIEARADLDLSIDPQPYFIIPSALERVFDEDSPGVDVSEIIVVHSISLFNPRLGIPSMLYAADRDSIAATASLQCYQRPKNPVYNVRRMDDPNGQNPANAMVWYLNDSLNLARIGSETNISMSLRQNRLELAMRYYLEGLFFNRDRSLTQSRQNGLFGDVNNAPTRRLYLPVPALRDYERLGYANEYDAFAMEWVLLLECVGNQPSVVVLNGCGIKDIELCVPDDAARQRLDDAILRAYSRSKNAIQTRSNLMDRSRAELGYFLLDPQPQGLQEVENPAAPGPDHLRMPMLLEVQPSEEGQERENSGALGPVVPGPSRPPETMKDRILAWIREKDGIVSDEEKEQFINDCIEQRTKEGQTNSEILKSMPSMYKLSMNLLLSQFHTKKERAQQEESEKAGGSSSEEEGRSESPSEAEGPDELGASSASTDEKQTEEEPSVPGKLFLNSVEAKDQERSSHK